MLSIVIPVFNRLDLTRTCIASLRRHPPSAPHEIVVVDNGSTDGTDEWLAAQPDLRVVTNDVNRGYAIASNQGVAAARGDLIVSCNNDIEVDEGFADAHLDILRRDPDVVAVGSRLLFPGRTMIQHAGVLMFSSSREGTDPFGATHRFYRRPATYAPALRAHRYQVLTAALCTYRRDAFEAAGGFDEGYWNGYEDVDLCLTLGRRGGVLVYDPRSVAVHHESASGSERFVAAEANTRRLIDRWADIATVDLTIDGDARRVATRPAVIGPYRSPGVRTAAPVGAPVSPA